MPLSFRAKIIYHAAKVALAEHELAWELLPLSYATAKDAADAAAAFIAEMGHPPIETLWEILDVRGFPNLEPEERPVPRSLLDEPE